jgi:hypothetical protein
VIAAGEAGAKNTCLQIMGTTATGNETIATAMFHHIKPRDEMPPIKEN